MSAISSDWVLILMKECTRRVAPVYSFPYCMWFAGSTFIKISICHSHNFIKVFFSKWYSNFVHTIIDTSRIGFSWINCHLITLSCNSLGVGVHFLVPDPSVFGRAASLHPTIPFRRLVCYCVSTKPQTSSVSEVGACFFQRIWKAVDSTRLCRVCGSFPRIHSANAERS